MWSWREDKRGNVLPASLALKHVGLPRVLFTLFPNVALSEDAALVTALQDELQTLKAVSGPFGCVRALIQKQTNVETTHFVFQQSDRSAEMALLQDR